MKDYTSYLDDSETFILNYEIEKDKIIVNFASGENCQILYTKEEEEKILDIMKKQVKKAYKVKKKHKLLFIGDIIFLIRYIIYDIIYTLSLINGFSYNDEIIGILAFFSACGVWFCGKQSIKRKKIISDIEKNKLLIDNEQKLNDNLEEHSNLLSNAPDKIKKLTNTNSNKPIFTVNSADKITLKELKYLLEQIRIYEVFNAESIDEQEEILRRSLKNNSNN